MLLELYKGETRRPIEFSSGLDLDGQTLRVKAYSKDGQSYDIESTGVTSVGNPPNQRSVVFIMSPSDMPPGEYVVKIYTDEVVVSKDFMIHYGDNPYATE